MSPIRPIFPWRPVQRILDWFHISMRFEHVLQRLRGLRNTERATADALLARVEFVQPLETRCSQSVSFIERQLLSKCQKLTLAARLFESPVHFGGGRRPVRASSARSQSAANWRCCLGLSDICPSRAIETAHGTGLRAGVG